VNLPSRAEADPARDGHGPARHNDGTMNVTSELLLALAPLHLGGLHPYEQVLVLVVAFGPFAVLAGVVFFLRRRDVAEEEANGRGDGAETRTPG